MPDTTRNVACEIIENNLDHEGIIDVLDSGTEVRKRKKGVLEKWKRSGSSIIIVTVEEREDIWLIRHVGRIKATRKKMKLLRRE